MAEHPDSARDRHRAGPAGAGTARVDATLRDDRIILHDEHGSRELRLPYLIHSGLIQTAELGQLIAERLLDELDDPPPSGAPLRLRLPSDWGVLRFVLPYDPSLQPDPHRQIEWEVECNAPESAGQYLVDWESGPEGTCVIAARKSLVRFAQALSMGLSLKLVQLGVQDGEDPDGEESGWLDVERASRHADARDREHYREPLPWRRAALAIAAVLLLVWAGTALLARRNSVSGPIAGERGGSVEPTKPGLVAEAIDEPVASEDPPTASADTLLAGAIAVLDESVAVDPRPVPVEPEPEARSTAEARPPAPAPAQAAAAVAGRPEGLLLAWRDLLDHLAAKQERLPDFLVIDAGGILVRSGGPQELPLTDIVGRPSRASRVDGGSYWLHFDQPLWPVPGGLLPEDPTRRPGSFQVDDLGALAGRLDTAPQKLILQRLRDRGDGVGTVNWRFDAPATGQALGWRVRSLPLAGPLGQGPKKP